MGYRLRISSLRIGMASIVRFRRAMVMGVVLRSFSPPSLPSRMTANSVAAMWKRRRMVSCSSSEMRGGWRVRSAGLVVLECVELLAVAPVKRGGCEEQQDSVAIDESGERLLGAAAGDQESEAEEELCHFDFRVPVFLVAAFFWTRRL